MNVTTTEKGDAGEIVAGYTLAMIFDGQFYHETLRGEAIGALDLQFKYPLSHLGGKTWHQLAIQVKTGLSFGSWPKTKSRWTISGIDKEHIKKWCDSNQPLLLIWVKDLPKTKLYWKIFSKHTPVTTIAIPDRHQLNPAAKFEISRLVNILDQTRGNLSPLTITEENDITKIRKIAKAKYKKISGEYSGPLGTVSITNYAWRHLTRPTRNKRYIKDSLQLLPCINSILAINPHRVQTLSQTEKEVNNQVVVKRKVLATYKNVRFATMQGIKVYNVFIRLAETVIYNKNWRELYPRITPVRQELILESVYRKSKVRLFKNLVIKPQQVGAIL